MSQRAITYVQTLQEYLTETEYAVAMALARLARDEDDAAHITMTSLAALVHRSERWTRKLIRALERYGLVISHHQQLGVRWTKTTYRFVQLEETRPKSRPDPEKVISFAKVCEAKPRPCASNTPRTWTACAAPMIRYSCPA